MDTDHLHALFTRVNDDPDLHARFEAITDEADFDALTAELGYEVTSTDFTGPTDDTELADVAGGERESGRFGRYGRQRCQRDRRRHQHCRR